MNNDGWIKLHRKITEWEWWDDHNTTRLFIYLITKANHKDRNWRGTIVKCGELITSIDKLALQTGLSSQQIRTSLKRLKSTNEITSEATNQYTKIIVENYKQYQISQQTNQQTNQQTDNKQITTNKNYKELKNTIINISFDQFWNLYDYKVGSKVKLKKKWDGLSDSDRNHIMKHIPQYIKTTPDKKFRKHPATYLNNQGWEDEIVIEESIETLDQQIVKRNSNMKKESNKLLDSIRQADKEAMDFVPDLKAMMKG